MRTSFIALGVIGLVLSATSLVWPSCAQAQSDGARPAVAAAPVTAIGRVVTAAGSVTIEHVNAVVVQASTGQPTEVKVGDPVYLGDVVQTGADGKLGVAFTDGTAFTLSSSARMVLNEFVYDPNGKSNSTLFSLTKGTFTFVAGKVAKTGDMKIDTPVATMGIRGTTPHVEISEDGSVRFSTLIEEGKDGVNTKGAGPRGKGQKRATSAPAPVLGWKPGQEGQKPNLTICGSC
jgi:hypothetical protein